MRSCAFTRLELVVVVVILLVLVFLLLPALSNYGKPAKRVTCAAQLKKIGYGMSVVAIDHTNLVAGGNNYSVLVPTNLGGSLEFAGTGQVFRHFQALSNEVVSTAALVCPSDSRRPSGDWRTLVNSNISYFISVGADETMPNMLLAGDRHLDSLPPRKGGVLLLTTNTTLRWGLELHSGQGGNVVLADGSVPMLSASSLPTLISTDVTVAFTNRLEFP